MFYSISQIVSWRGREQKSRRNTINGHTIFNTILKSDGKIPGNMPNVSGSIFYPQSHKKICRSTSRGFIAKDSFNIVYWHKKSDETFIPAYP